MDLSCTRRIPAPVTSLDHQAAKSAVRAVPPVYPLSTPDESAPWAAAGLALPGSLYSGMMPSPD